jgi:alpha-glucosidase (family GH31 glycosyl hydrolase)
VNLVTWIMPGVFDGTPPPGAFTSSDNQYLDLTDQSQVDWYRNKLKTGQYPYGIMGHKLDRIDNGWGMDQLPSFKDGTPEPERHKKYAYLNCKISEEFLRVDAGLGSNCFLFPRCAVARCQQFIHAIWNGDSYADWGGMVTSVGNAFRAAILGFPMWGSDIGGYKQKSMPSIQNYCRWLSFGVYSGFMELMLDGKEPWKLSGENQGYIRDIFNERFTLLPYIYSILNTSAENGVTMKPLVGEYPDDPKTYSLVDEHLFGPAMLVAPITSNANSRNVYLPAGKWINMHNWADKQDGGKDITSPQMPLTQIPVYIKANSIYPTGEVFAGLAKKWDPDFDSKRTITINSFPGSAGESVSFTYVDYVDGNKEKLMTLEVDANNVITITAPAMTVPGAVAVRLSSAPTTLYLGTTQIPSPAYDAGANRLTVPFEANQPIQVTVNGTPPTGIGTHLEPVEAKGFVMTRHSGKGVELIIPRITGLTAHSKADVSVFSLAGREMVNRKVLLNRYGSTRLKVPTGKGIFLVKTSIRDISIGTAKIIVP